MEIYSTLLLEISWAWIDADVTLTRRLLKARKKATHQSSLPILNGAPKEETKVIRVKDTIKSFSCSSVCDGLGRMLALISLRCATSENNVKKWGYKFDATEPSVDGLICGIENEFKVRSNECLIFSFQGIEMVFRDLAILAIKSRSYESSGLFQSEEFWYPPWSHLNKSINLMQKKLLKVDRNSILDYHQAAPVPPQKSFYNFLCAIAFLGINSMQKNFFLLFPFVPLWSYQKASIMQNADCGDNFFYCVLSVQKLFAKIFRSLLLITSEETENEEMLFKSEFNKTKIFELLPERLWKLTKWQLNARDE